MTSFFAGGFPPNNDRPAGSQRNPQGGDGEGGGIPKSNPLKNPLVITLLILALIGLVIYAMAHTWTEVLWFQQVGADRVIWTRWVAIAVIALVSFLVLFASVALTVQWAYRKRPLMGARSTMRVYQQALEPMRNLVFWGVPALIALTMAGTYASSWQQILMWLHRQPFGEVDPQFGIDISFYVFTVPVLQLLLSLLMNAAVLSLVGVLIVNYVYGGLTFSPKLRATRPARKQIGLIAAVISLLFGLRYWLGIYSMLYQNGGPNAIVDGALYTDISATLPAHLILAVVSVLVAVMFIVAAFRGTWRLPVTGVAVTIVSALVIGMAYPALIQQFRVTPNARQMEQPYIQRNIDATLKAYGLDDVEYQTYAAKTDASPGQLREDSESTSQIRLLDPAVVSPTFRQLQQSRPYYTFDEQLSVDRYTIDGERRDTVIAVRDLNLNGLQEEQQTWVNLHTVYTHGYGVAAAYGNAVRPDGTPSFWEQSIPSVGEIGDYEERVYFSPKAPVYSIVGAPEGTPPQELDYPDDNAPSGQVQTTFTGDGGPSVGNFFNKLLFAVKFGSTDIFFSSQTNSESQILFDRDPIQRVKKVAPFLTLEQKAYPAVVDMDDDPSTTQRLVWIIDGYTTANSYPYAEHQSLTEATTDSRTLAGPAAAQFETINYMRNSVKAVVDAYDGSVKLFSWDDQDPLLGAWQGVYPGLIQDKSEISGDLMSHLRYPEDLFKVQRSLLATYHVTEAAEFYTGGDRWRLSEDPTSASTDAAGQTQQKLQAPYYLTMQMPTQESAEFSLTSVYVPAGGGEARRAAMAGFLAVDSETGNEPGKVRDGYGKLRLIALPSSTTVPGPGQVQNAFNSDQTIASELNLLNQQGSKVISGNLLTLPVGGGLLYVQPVYVQSTGSTSYPVLRYVLTAFGDQIGFARTLQESLDQTFGGDSEATVAGSEGEPEAPDESTDQTLQQQLSKALASARDALKAGQDAMSNNDWTAYGKAQNDLQKALEKAVQIQSQLDAEAAALLGEPADPADGGAPPGDVGPETELGSDAEQG